MCGVPVRAIGHGESGLFTFPPHFSPASTSLTVASIGLLRQELEVEKEKGAQAPSVNYPISIMKVG
jgi:hypothetical protein